MNSDSKMEKMDPMVGQASVQQFVAAPKTKDVKKQSASQSAIDPQFFDYNYNDYYDYGGSVTNEAQNAGAGNGIQLNNLDHESDNTARMADAFAGDFGAVGSNKLAQKRKLALMRRKLKQKLLKKQQQLGATGGVAEGAGEARMIGEEMSGFGMGSALRRRKMMGQNRLDVASGGLTGFGDFEGTSASGIGEDFLDNGLSGLRGDGIGGGGGIGGYGMGGGGGGGGGGAGLGFRGPNALRRGGHGGGNYKVAHLGGHGGFHGGGYGDYGHAHGGGHGGHGNVVIIKKKKNTDQNNGLFGQLEEIFGDLGLDFETFALLLGVAGAAATALLASTLLSQGKRKRDFTTEPWYMIILMNLAEYVHSGKKGFEIIIFFIAWKTLNYSVRRLYRRARDRAFSPL